MASLKRHFPPSKKIYTDLRAILMDDVKLVSDKIIKFSIRHLPSILSWRENPGVWQNLLLPPPNVTRGKIKVYVLECLKIIKRPLQSISHEVYPYLCTTRVFVVFVQRLTPFFRFTIVFGGSPPLLGIYIPGLFQAKPKYKERAYLLECL